MSGILAEGTSSKTLVEPIQVSEANGRIIVILVPTYDALDQCTIARYGTKPFSKHSAF